MNGIKVNVFKIGKYKDMGVEWRDLMLEECEKIMEMVNIYFQVFISVVSEGCNMIIDEVKNFLIGEMWFVENVIGVFVDEFGGMDIVIDVFEKLMNVSGVKVVVYKDFEIFEEFGVYGSIVFYIDFCYFIFFIGGG